MVSNLPGDVAQGAVFVGRADTVADLGRSIAAALSGRGGLVLLAGGPGIGKTRTIEEVGRAARGRGMRVLAGRCVEDGTASSYWPIGQILRRWADDPASLPLAQDLRCDLETLAAGFPELRTRFPNLAPARGLDAEHGWLRLADAFAGILRRTSHDAPLLVTVDDLHWADPGSFLLLHLLATEVVDARILLLATYRDLDIGEDHPLAASLAKLIRLGRTITLGGLEPGDVAQLMESVLGLLPPTGSAALVWRRTGGNPLFVLELTRILAAEVPGRISRVDDLASVRMPPALRHAIRSRLERLSAFCQRVLGVASVIGGEVSVKLLSSVLEGDGRDFQRSLEAIDEAMAAGLLTPTDAEKLGFRFTHALVREVLYEALAPRERLSLHRRVAEALEALPDRGDARLSELAHHFCRAAPGGGAEKAVEYSRRAGDQARQRWAYDDAIAHYRRALVALELASLPSRELHVDLLLDLGQSQLAAGLREAAKETAERAFALAEDLGSAEQLARAALAYPAIESGDTMSPAMSDPRQRLLLERGREALSSDDGLLRARVLSRLSTMGGDRAALSAEALEMARRLGDPATLVAALEARHFALWEPDHLEERLALAAEITRIAERTGDRFTEVRACHAGIGELLELGDRAGFARTIDRLEVLVRELRQPRLRILPLFPRACHAFLMGRLEESERLANESLALAQAADAPDALSVYGGQLGLIRREQARLAELLPVLRAQAATLPGVPAFRSGLAWALAEIGQLEEAQGELDRVASGSFADLPCDGFRQMTVHMLAEVATATCDLERARLLHDLLRPYSGRNVVVGPVLCFGAADRSLAKLAAALGRPDEARRRFEAALVLDDGMGAVPCLAHTRLDFARFLLAQGSSGERQRAYILVEQAREDGRANRLTLVVARAELLLPALQGIGPDAGATRERRAASRGVRGTYEAALANQGDTWLVGYGGREVRVQSSKGLFCLAELLREPGRPIAALDLMALSDVGGAFAGRDGATQRYAPRAATVAVEPVLDARAREEYRRRLVELREDLVEAERLNDVGRSARLQEEIGAIEVELGAAFGLGGRPRRVGDVAERARKAVYMRIRNTTAHLRTLHPELARHLELTVRTGGICVYEPETPISWKVS